ncbi:hypothetical protein K474DRAFT_1503849 [Panus rudis PR-1116 ss-1]|nr:hypothetical protein K474DRAFT_1503849 [Panus rudis PR-1116 ss-1]
MCAWVMVTGSISFISLRRYRRKIVLYFIPSFSSPCFFGFRGGVDEETGFFLDFSFNIPTLVPRRSQARCREDSKKSKSKSKCRKEISQAK